MELGGYNITYVPRTAVKGQVLADFINEVSVGTRHEEVCSLTREGDSKGWTLYTDGASSLKVVGAGLVLIDPSGTEYTYAIRITFLRKIYLYTCGKVDAAAECFSLAGCYSEAAEAYAKGEESGHFLEAAELAWSLGDVIKEADLLEKVGYYKEAAVLLLWYVYFSSLWGNGNSGWPLKQFPQKELNVLCDHYNSLHELKNGLDISQKNRSLRGEILLVRKILNKHLHLNSSKYEWEDEENVVNILESLGSFHNEEPDEDELYVDFSLVYFGVRKHNVNGNTVYLLVNKDAEWVGKWGDNGLHMDGTNPTIDGRQLVYAIRSYWQSELVSVGIKAVNLLTSQIHIKLQRFLGISLTYFDLVFPLDWRKSVSKTLVSLRETDLSVKLLNEIILQYVDMKGDFTYWTIGRVMMICLGSKTSVALYERIINKLLWDPKWKSFVEKFRDDGLKELDVHLAFTRALNDTFTANWRLAGYISTDSFVHLLDRLLFLNSWLSQTFYTTKSSFVGWFTYLHSPATPSKLMPNPKFSPEFINFYVQIAQKILFKGQDTMSWLKRSDLDLSDYLPILASRLIMLLSLICLQASDDCSEVLLDLLLDGHNIACLLPKKLVSNLLRRWNGHCLNLTPWVVAEAFSSIEDPLVIVCSGDMSPKIHAPCAIFVDLRKSREEIKSVLFSRKTTLGIQNPSKNDDCWTIDEATCYRTLYSNMCVDLLDGGERVRRINCQVLNELIYLINDSKNESLREISEFLNGPYKESPNILSVKSLFKKEMEKNLHTFTTARKDGILRVGEDITDLDSAFDKLNDLLQALYASPEEVENSVIVDAMNWLKSPWPDTKECHMRGIVESESQDAKNTKVKGNNKGKNSKAANNDDFPSTSARSLRSAKILASPPNTYVSEIDELGVEDITDLDGAFDKLSELLQAFVASPEEVENSVIEDVVDWLKSPFPDAKEYHKRYVVPSEFQDAKIRK
ncbi:hypothetical protein Tco_0317726 [Tanacetum coccineum]